MQAKHTPGPWIVAKRPAGKRQATIVLDAERNEVCEVYDSAALIAAAPDLLAALREIVDHFQRTGDPTLGDMAPRARAAIARATGE